MRPRPLTDADLDWVHALNEAHAAELAPMSAPDFRALAGNAFYAGVVEPQAAFLLAFDRKPAPISPNFDWFAARYDRLLYIDRVAVAAAHRRKGLAGALYRDAFAAARREGFALIGCEVNADPPNPASDAFHAALGFRPVGAARLADRNKTVRYFVRRLTGSD